MGTVLNRAQQARRGRQTRNYLIINSGQAIIAQSEIMVGGEEPLAKPATLKPTTLEVMVGG